MPIEYSRVSIVTSCSIGYKTGQKKVSFLLHENQELKWKWIYFVNSKEWLPTVHSVIFIDHFEKKCGKNANSSAVAIAFIIYTT